jgi:hypothetical protein
MNTGTEMMRKWKWPFVNGCQHNSPMCMVTVFPNSGEFIKVAADHIAKQPRFFVFYSTAALLS